MYPYAVTNERNNGINQDEMMHENISIEIWSSDIFTSTQLVNSSMLHYEDFIVCPFDFFNTGHFIKFLFLSILLYSILQSVWMALKVCTV